ncbi:MAG TPA: hypothetical protein VH682_13940 [Gemmataceae bacterium]|jgi:hypothetical protein
MLVLSRRAHEPNTLSPALLPFKQLVDRRLAIAQKGLAEARRHLAAGQAADADTVLEKLDEDLHLLRRRLDSMAEPATPGPSVLRGCAGAASEAN